MKCIWRVSASEGIIQINANGFLETSKGAEICGLQSRGLTPDMSTILRSRKKRERAAGCSSFSKSSLPQLCAKVPDPGIWQYHVNRTINDLLIRCVLLITSPRSLPRVYVTGICPFLQLGTTWVGLICLLDQRNQRLLFKLYWLHKRCSFLPLELWDVLKTKGNNKKEVNWICRYTFSFFPKLSYIQSNCFSRFNYY